MASDLPGQDVPGESYLDKVGRLRMARFDAEAQVLRDPVLLPPEATPSTTSPAAALPVDPTPPVQSTRPAGWLPTVLTPDHPRYHDLDEDPGLRKT